MATALVGLLLVVFIGCQDQGIAPIRDSTVASWSVVPELANVDSRYMVEHGGIIYLVGVRLDVSPGTPGRGVVYESIDGVNWTKIRTQVWDLGPSTFQADSLFVLSDSIYVMSRNGANLRALSMPDGLLDVNADGDAVFQGPNLYAMQTFYGNALQTFRINTDGSNSEIFPLSGRSYAGAKFFKTTIRGIDRIFVRPHWAAGGFFEFKNENFISMTNGLNSDQLLSSPTNAMATKGDTLFAGFNSPGEICTFEGDHWEIYGDTLPYSKAAYSVTPTLRTQPTAIAFARNRMFVATHCLGVLEWTDGGWVQRSMGLAPGFIPGISERDLYAPIPILQYFKGILIAAYGKPGYAPWGGQGVYILHLEGLAK